MHWLDHFYREVLGRSRRTRVIAGSIALLLGVGVTASLWMGRDGVRVISSLPLFCAVGGLFVLVDGLTDRMPRAGPGRASRSGPPSAAGEWTRERDREILSRLFQAKKEGRSALRTLHDLGIEDPALRKRYFQMLEWMQRDAEGAAGPDPRRPRPQ